MEMDNFTLLNFTNFTFMENDSIFFIEDGDPNKQGKVISLALPVPEAAVSAILLSFLIIITLVGNVLVILSVFTYRPLRTVQNFFIVSLAIADLAVAALVMPFHVVVHLLDAWVFGIIFCEIWLTCDVLCCTASILNLSAIALDRYWAIHDPINYARKRTLKRVMIMIALVWCISAVISIPPLIGWNDWKDGLETHCELTAERGYIIYSSCGSFFIPLFIMTIVYIKIFLATRRRLRERARAAKAVYSQNKGTKTVERTSSDTPSEQDEASTDNVKTHHTHIKPNNSTASHSEYSETNRLNPATPEKGHVQVHQFLEEKQKISLSKERRAARTLGIIMGVFVLCWLPFFLLYVIVPFCNCGEPDDRLANFILWLGYVNSALNPIIYTIFNIDFRRAFARLLGAKCRN